VLPDRLAVQLRAGEAALRAVREVGKVWLLSSGGLLVKAAHRQQANSST
jgi:hypothetical protein